MLTNKAAADKAGLESKTIRVTFEDDQPIRVLEAASSAQSTLQTGALNASATLGSAIAAADRSQSEGAASATQTMRTSEASSSRTREESVGQGLQDLGEAEASASTSHASAILPAWETHRSQGMALDATHEKALSTALTDFAKAVEPTRLVLDDLAGSPDGPLRVARAALPIDHAQAESQGSIAFHQSMADRLTHWNGQVSNGMAGLDIQKYQAYRTIALAAEESLEPSWWGQMIPVFGAVYSSANNYSQGNYFWGTVDGLFAVTDVFGARALFNGIYKLGSKAAATTTTRQAGASASRSNVPLKILQPEGCFVAGTLVQTLTGPVPIEEMKVGDQVWAYSHESQQWAGRGGLMTSAGNPSRLRGRGSGRGPGNGSGLGSGSPRF